MHRTLKPLLIAALATIPAGQALAATHKATPTPKPTPKAKTAVKSKKVTGPLVDMRWGPVQATITVKGKKLTGVAIATQPENFRSQFIDEQSVPLLKQETLQAQNANIDLISGATMTSEAYVESLTAALQKAHLPTGV